MDNWDNCWEELDGGGECGEIAIAVKRYAIDEERFSHRGYPVCIKHIEEPMIPLKDLGY